MTPTARGWTSLVGGVLWTIITIATGQADLAPIGLFLVALPLVSLLAMLPSARPLHASRQLPDTLVCVGDLFAWQIDFDTDGLNPGGVGILTEELEPGIGQDVTSAFRLGAQPQEVTASFHTTAQRRGCWRIGPTHITFIHALGFARVRRTTKDADSVVVAPRVHPLGPSNASSADAVGAHLSSGRHGLASVDDAIVRPYVSGDDIRRVHWRSTARVGSLVVRREDDAWDQQAQLLLDTRSAFTDTVVVDPRFEAMVELTASLAVHLIHTGYAVRLTDTSGQSQRFDQSPDIASHEALLALAEVRPTPGDLTPLTVARRRRGDLVIAVLAHVDVTDAYALTSAAHGGCAIVMGRDSAPRLPTEVIDAFADGGWRCVPATTAMSPAAIWQACVEPRA